MVEYGNGGNLEVTMDGPFAGSGASGGGSVKMTTITAPVANWKGGESPYSMAVGVDGVTITSKVDVQLNAELITALEGQIISFVAQNNGGLVTLYAFGDKPQADCELQAVLTEVLGDGLIVGNIASIGGLRADYAQDDPSKADYIFNKPNEAISNAQKTADEAKVKAEAALPKEGGTMSGPLFVQAPTADSHAAPKGYVDTSVRGTYAAWTVSVPASGWTGDGPYTQTISVPGVLASDRPHICLVPADDVTIAETQEEAWGCVSRGVANDGTVVFTCYEEKPEVNITVQVEVNR